MSYGLRRDHILHCFSRALYKSLRRQIDSDTSVNSSWIKFRWIICILIVFKRLVCPTKPKAEKWSADCTLKERPICKSGKRVQFSTVDNRFSRSSHTFRASTFSRLTFDFRDIRQSEVHMTWIPLSFVRMGVEFGYLDLTAGIPMPSMSCYNF